MNRKIKNPVSLTKLLVYFILLIVLAAVVFPMIWLLYSSLKTDQAIFISPLELPKWNNFQWDNYVNAWIRAHFGRYFFNSVLVSGSTVVLTLILASMIAYTLARFSFRGSRFLLLLFLAGLMIPLQLWIVPLFFQMKEMHMLNSLSGLVIVYVATGLPFAVFILVGFFKTLPITLHEAAVLDGAGEITVFWRIMLPLARPGLITVAIFTFLGSWGEYLLAFMFLSGQGSENVRTLPLGLANVAIVSQHRSDWGVAFAALVLVMLPALAVYILLQKHLTKGITMGAVKG